MTNAQLVAAIQTDLAKIRANTSTEQAALSDAKARLAQIQPEAPPAPVPVPVPTPPPVPPPVPTPPPPVPAPVGIAVLDDFSQGNRLVPGIGLLWSHYQEGAPGSVIVANGSLVETVGAITNPQNGGAYLQFQPKTNNSYAFPGGYAQSWLVSGGWNPNYNRLRFRVTPNISVPVGGDHLWEFGTYIRTHRDSDSDDQGAHFYHFLSPSANTGQPIYVTITRVPQHQVGGDPNQNWPENPTGDPYFDDLTRFYLDAVYGGLGHSQLTYNDFEFSQVTGEADALISNLTAQYTGGGYEVTWQALKNQSRAFAVFTAVASMHVNGIASGTPAGTVTAPGSAYTHCRWTNNQPKNPSGCYVAIQPAGSALFTEVFIP